ncbi:MAG: hypothetical protein ABR599_06960 [Gemmatimonadota bacterium]
MLKRFQHHLLACLAVAGLVLTAACQQRQEVDDEFEGDTLMVEDTTLLPPPPTDMGADTMMGMDTMGMDTMDMSADTMAM